MSNHSNISFPDSFIKTPHPSIKNATWWIYRRKPNARPAIAVMGGGKYKGEYGDGITTFNLWDLREDQPRVLLTSAEINKHLRNYPVTKGDIIKIDIGRS